MNFLESPLLAVIAVVTVATILALIRTFKRDRCLMHFHDYHISLTEKDGTVTWGRVDVATSGLEIYYPDSRRSEKGFWKQGVLFYKDQYEAMDGLYRSTTGLSDDQCERRKQYLERIADPGFFHRLGRQLRNWMGMIRDSVVQAATLAIGAARSKARPGMAILTRDEDQVSTLSSEIVGHAGNAYDPILERHLFTRVIVHVTRDDTTHQYCGYLADYTKEFLEIVDTEVNSKDEHFESRALYVGDDAVDGIDIAFEDGQLSVTNRTENMLLFKELLHGDQYISIGAVLPVDFKAYFRIGADIDPGRVKVVLATAGRVDMLVPRSHAIVRHGVTGLDEEELQIPE